MYDSVSLVNSNYQIINYIPNTKSLISNNYHQHSCYANKFKAWEKHKKLKSEKLIGIIKISLFDVALIFVFSFLLFNPRDVSRLVHSLFYLSSIHIY